MKINNINTSKLSQIRSPLHLNMDRCDTLGFDNGLISDYKGKIKHILFNYDPQSKNKQKNEILNAYNTIYNNLSKGSKITFFVQNSNDSKTIKSSIEAEKKEGIDIDFIEIKNLSELNLWIRDCFLPVYDNKTLKLLIQNCSNFSRDVQKIIAENLKSCPSIKIEEENSLYIDGGNIISGDKKAIIGNLTIEDMIQKLKIETGNREELIKNLIESKIDKKLIIVGKDNPDTQVLEKQPISHIDLMVTLIDDNTAILASNYLAVNTLLKLSKEEMALQSKEFEDACGVHNMDDYDQPLLNFYIDTYYESVTDMDYNYEHNLNSIEKELNNAGIKTIRVPFLPPIGNVYPIVTYNNSLIEGGKSQKKVFLPVYNIKSLDEIAKNVYKQLGFEVIPIEVAAISRSLGALRCMSLVIDRMAN